MKFRIEFFEKDDPPEFKDEFHLKLALRANASVRILSIVAAILFPLFGILDHVLFPLIAWKLNLIRVALMPVILLVFFFTFRKGAHRHVNLSATLLFQAMALAIDLMVYHTGGAASRYDSGVNLVLLAMFVYMAWKPMNAVLNGLLIYLVYAGVLVAAAGGLPDVRLLVSNSYFMLSSVFIGTLWTFIGLRMFIRETRATYFLEAERDRSERLLLNILPVAVARELQRSDAVQPIHFQQISVLFTDFVGFTRSAMKMSPEQLVHELDGCFQEFDRVIERYRLEKLKTIGDSYMCAGGVPVPKRTHAVDCVSAALEILTIVRDLQKKKREAGDEFWDIRLGIHSGPAVAGVIGTKKFSYDIWGDTVNTASRLETAAEANTVNISRDTYFLVKGFFDCERRGPIMTKGKGKINMYRVIGIKPDLYDAELQMPNIQFFRKYRSYLVYGRGSGARE